MPAWNGKYRMTIKRFNGGKWTPVKRCLAVTKGSGGGYSGPHQCTLTATANYNGWPLCWIHLQSALRRGADMPMAAGVAFFMKQMTKRAPIPNDLLIREYPNA